MLKKAETVLLLLLITAFFSACPGKEEETPEETQHNPNSVQSYPLQTAPLTPAAALTPSAIPKDPNEIVRFSTEILNKDEDRVHNIKIAADEINHTVLDPDEVFSFNNILGKRTDDKGYEKAPILLGNGEKGEGTGGGICQISTTLYNAALKADLEIVERHRHSEPIPYVEEGKDATVVYNSKDLRFRNTRDYPIEILVSVSEDKVTVKLYKKKASED
jgi:vancomycin resistance protein YoaR